MGITTVYYHLIFTTLDLSVISDAITYKLSANITALQIHEQSNLDAFYSGFSLKRSLILKNEPVRSIFIIILFIFLKKKVF
jgi:hypothetical protein